jgi:hypothetical protein
MGIMGFLESLKRLVGIEPGSDSEDAGRPRRRDSEFGRGREKEAEELPPERAAELAGHATERVDT